METLNIETPYINTIEVKKAVKGMSRGKARDSDDLSMDLIKNEGDFLLDKLAIPFTKWFQTCSIPCSTWKNIIIQVTRFTQA